MAVFTEPPENVCGLHPCDHYLHRDRPERILSRPGDLENLIMFSLRRFARVLQRAIRASLCSYGSNKTELGAELIGLREAFNSQDCGKRFLGYLFAQKRLSHLRTQPKREPSGAHL